MHGAYRGVYGALRGVWSGGCCKRLLLRYTELARQHLRYAQPDQRKEQDVVLLAFLCGVAAASSGRFYFKGRYLTVACMPQLTECLECKKGFHTSGGGQYCTTKMCSSSVSLPN